MSTHLHLSLRLHKYAGQHFIQDERTGKQGKQNWLTNKNGNIIIPASRFVACLVCAADVLRQDFKGIGANVLRVHLTSSDFTLNKSPRDAKEFTRQIPLKNPDTGKIRSRITASDPYITDADAVGTLTLSDKVNVETILRLVKRAGVSEDCGIGALRKMGFGMFDVSKHMIEA